MRLASKGGPIRLATLAAKRQTSGSGTQLHASSAELWNQGRQSLARTRYESLRGELVALTTNSLFLKRDLVPYMLS